MARRRQRKINTAYDVKEAFKVVEDELISSMIRNLDHHRAEELKEGFNWSQWQVEQLAALDEYKKRNLKKYKGVFGNINNKIDTLIAMQRQAGRSAQEVSILKAIKAGANLIKAKKQIEAAGMFFKVNDNKMNALIRATTSDFERAEIAMLRRANDQYRKIIFNAQLYAASGATYEQAVDMATKDFLTAGINCIQYSNGARHTISDYADMALKTAQKRAYLTGEGETRMEYGITTVIMNKRTDACPKCTPFVGKVMVDDVWSGGRSDGISDKTGVKYPLMSDAIKKGLYHPRCKDHHTTYFEGISTPPDDSYSREELQQLAADYNAQQKQDYAQRQAEKYGRLAKYSLDPANKRKYQARAEEWEKQIDKTIDFGIMALTDKERYALNQYISFESYGLNYKLRNNIELSVFEKEMMNKLDNALKKIPFFEGDVSRSLYFGDSSLVEEFVKKLKVNKPVCFDQYLSVTSSHQLYNPEGEIQIYIQNSKKGRDLTSINIAESEVLYERNAVFMVKHIEKNNNQYNILLEER